MNSSERQKIQNKIISREKLRGMGRIKRLLQSPLRTLPFYFLATLGHILPYRLRFKTLWGTRMRCYLPEGNTFYYYGYCEANLTNFALRYIKESMVCVDVGAHVGFYTMLFAELVGGRGTVFSFEPTPWTFSLLKENTGDLPMVDIFQKAISSTPKEITLSDYGPGYGAYNSAHASGAADLAKESSTVKVKAVTLDDQFEFKNLQPDFVKIDAEGFEYEVLLGMTRILSRKGARPVVSIEVAGGDVWAKERNKALSLLEDSEYQLFEITVDGSLIKHEIKDSYGYDNLVAVPKEKLSEIKDLI